MQIPRMICFFSDVNIVLTDTFKEVVPQHYSSCWVVLPIILPLTLPQTLLFNKRRFILDRKMEKVIALVLALFCSQFSL